MKTESELQLSGPKLKSELRRLARKQVEMLKELDRKAGFQHHPDHYRWLRKKQLRHMLSLKRAQQLSLVEEMNSLEQLASSKLILPKRLRT